MKTLFSFFLILLFNCFALAQTEQARPLNCFVTADYIEKQEQEIISRKPKNSMARTGDDGSIKYIPIKIHWVRNTDGSFGRHNDPNKLFRVFEKINEIWSDINIQLVVDKDIHYINNSAWLSPARDSEAYHQLMAVKVAGFANVWMVEGWAGSPASGYGGPSGVELAEIGIQIDGHEFGHFLSLAHTFDTGNGIELVTRDPNNGANCSTAGDGICDTEADPYGLQPGQYLGAEPTSANCLMTSDTRDTKGVLYTPPYNNFMSYYGGCGYIFTPGQNEKMRDAYFQYHSNYQLLTTGLSEAPTNLAVVKENDIQYLSWQSAGNSIGIQVEYSDDNGISWKVMPTFDKGNDKLPLGELTVGDKVKLRARHLNSYTYSEVIDYASLSNFYCMPTTEFKAPAETGGIGTFTLTNTTLDNQTKTNESYSLINNNAPVKLFNGGTYSFNIKPIFNANGSTSYTYFGIWLDENGDGDFDDAGERKLVQDKFEFEVNGSFSIQGTPGKTRLRVRSFGNGNTGNPCGFFSESETEDYVVEIVNDQAPVITNATYNAVQKNITVQWTDNSTVDGYVIQRTADGIAFTEAGTIAAGQPKTFTDTQFLPDTQYGYRVAKINSTKYSNEFVVVSGKAALSYCTPLSDNGCAVGYEISEFKITEVQFTKNSNGQCQNGYANYTSENPINLTAGTTYTFNIANNNSGKFEHLLIAADINQDGTFGADETLFQYEDPGAAINIGTFSIPAGAATGKTVLRVRGYFNPIPDACGRASYGETEDYSIFISGGRQPAVEALTVTPAGAGQLKIGWTLPSFASATGVQIAQSTDGTNYSVIHQASVTDTQYIATGLQPNTRYYYRLITVGSQNSEAKFAWGDTEPLASLPVITAATTVGDFVNGPFTVNFVVNETTTQFKADDLQLVNASATNFIGSDKNYSVTVTPLAEGAVRVNVKANAILNSQNAGNAVSNSIETNYDITQPAITFTPLISTHVNRPIRIKFNATEPLNGFSINSLTVTNAVMSDFYAKEEKYNVLITPTAEGPVSVSMLANALTDRAGNTNGNAFALNFDYDITPPIANISSASLADVDGPFDISITLSESSSNFGVGDVTATNGTIKLLASSTTVYNMRVIPIAGGNVTLQINANTFSDAAGNSNTSSNLLTRNYNPTGLLATLSSEAADTLNAAFLVNIATSAPTADLVAADLSVVNGTVTSFTGSASNYSAQITPSTEGVVTIEIENAKFTDGTLLNHESNRIQTYYDNTPPQVTLSWNKITGGYQVNLIISEANMGLAQSDLQVVKGFITNFEKFGKDYSFIINTDNTGNAEVSVPSGVFTDRAGNANSASNVLKTDAERIPPTLVVSTGAPSFVNKAFVVDVKASEELVGFTAEDITLVNGTMGGFTGNHTAYQFQVLPITDGPVQVAIAAGVMTDLNGNKNTASNALTVNYDGTAPTVTLSTTSGPAVSGPFTLSITGSEDINGLDIKSFSVNNGVASAIAGAGKNFTVKITPQAIGEVSVLFKRGAVVDRAGNKNVTEATLKVAFDYAGKPTVVVGILDESEDQIKVFPNPASQWLHIESEQFSYAQLTSINGVVTMKINERQADLSALAQGIYVLTIFNKKDIIVARKRVLVLR